MIRYAYRQKRIVNRFSWNNNRLGEGNIMIIEGLIDKEYMELMEKAGWKFDWKIEDNEQLKCASDKGLEVPDELDESQHAYIRFYVDMDIEQFYPPKQLVEDLPREELPLLIDTKNEVVRKEVEKVLKERKDNASKPTTRLHAYKNHL